MIKGSYKLEALPQGTQDLIAFFDRAKETMAYCRFVQEEYVKQERIESKYDLQGASHSRAYNERRYAPALTESEIEHYFKKTPIGYFTAQAYGERIRDRQNAIRICYWMARAKKLYWCTVKEKYRRTLKPTRI